MHDDHGMPLPSKFSNLPWGKHDHHGRLCDNDGDGIQTGCSEFYFEDDMDFVIHAANHIIQCRRIVRRLAEWGKKYPKGVLHSFRAEKEHDAIEEDAARLWAEMQQSAKGGERGE